MDLTPEEQEEKEFMEFIGGKKMNIKFIGLPDLTPKEGKLSKEDQCKEKIIFLKNLLKDGNYIPGSDRFDFEYTINDELCRTFINDQIRSLINKYVNGK